MEKCNSVDKHLTKPDELQRGNTVPTSGWKRGVTTHPVTLKSPEDGCSLATGVAFHVLKKALSTEASAGEMRPVFTL